MTGALVRCGIELVRRYNLNMEVNFLVELLESYDDAIGIYEEKKIIENGDLE